MHVNDYEDEPEDYVHGRDSRYRRENTVIKLFTRHSAVQLDVPESMHLFGECHLLEKLVEWVSPIGTLIKTGHSESFGLKFNTTDDEEIKRHLKELGEKWVREVELMGYEREVLRGDTFLP